MFGILFQPFSWVENSLQGGNFSSSRGKAHGYALYISVLLGITLWFFLFYPEPLYYGTSGSALQKEIPSILIANPLLSLFVVLFAVFIIIFLCSYLSLGFLSYTIMSRISKGHDPQLSPYLSFYSYALTPLLFWIPVMVFRTFFFERWINLRPLYPFFDWTTPNIVHLLLLGACLVWKFIIEVRGNQAIFRVSPAKALLPVLAQAGLCIGLVNLPFLFNDLFFNAFKDRLV